jgi:circadian clock protein KaiC
MKKTVSRLPTLPKAKTGISGFDDVTSGGLPRGRPTLICGGPGCGKTLFAAEFLVRGAVEHGEAGVFMAFEETEEDLVKNVASLGFDLKALIAQKKIAVDFVRVERAEIEETGTYNLDGLFIRLEHAVRETGAKRVVLDTVESLFSGLSNTAILRAELRRLFHWLKARKLTAVITGERGGEGSLTRQGLEEYVSDCVIMLDHRVRDQMSTRRLRIVKYRGSTHGTNEYPFIIDEEGLSVLPITTLGLEHAAVSTRLTTGIRQLDEILGGKGYFQGSTVMITGGAGTGKTSIAASFAASVCASGRNCLFIDFEESPSQLIRNMGSIGVDLGAPFRKGRLKVLASRPTVHGLEVHLVKLRRLVERHRPAAVVIDPVSSLMAVGSALDVQIMLTRIIDYLKLAGVTTLMTVLTGNSVDRVSSDVGVSSLVDTWIALDHLEAGGQRRRELRIIKSRGMAHSQQVQEYALSDQGVRLSPRG